MTHLKTDICVIGAGSGGLSVASGAAQMGADVVLIEASEMGGDCLNTGCVPSKALLAAAKSAQMMRLGGPGVAGYEPRVDYGAVMDHVRQTIAAIAPHDSQERFETLGCTVIRARAEFISPKEVRAGEVTITARRFVVATGSQPFVPPIPGIDTVDILTNEQIFSLDRLPDHLIVIGAGPIGLEMAQAHRRLGSRVTVLEAAEALANEDPALMRPLVESLRAEGVDIREGVRAEEISPDGTGVRVRVSGDEITGSHLLVAAGRKVDLSGLGLVQAQVATEKGRALLDAGLRSTTNRRVYVIGDAAGGMQFTHLAGYHAGVIVRPMLFGLPAKARTDHIPRVTYIAPELAQVGLTEAEARDAHGDKLTVLRQEFGGNDRAIAEGRAVGLLKVMVVSGRPVGASIWGPEAGNLIATWAIAIANRHKLTSLTSAVLPYPTLAEINKRAAGAYFSPKLFDSPMVKRVVRLVQRVLP